MYDYRSVLAHLLLTCSTILVLSCDRAPSSAPKPVSPAPSAVPAGYETVATVNGIAINESDVQRELSGHAKQPSHSPGQAKAVLENLIRQELAAQKAAELGLDANPKYREELYRLEAQVAAFKRRALSDLFFREHLTKQVEVTPADARKYFDDNANTIRTELRVSQILTRDEARIQQAYNSLRSGKSFDEVAQGLFPQLPPDGGKPWELPYLKWNQLPPAWRDIVHKLDKGQTSGILRGANDRFWIVKLVDKRDSDITFDAVRDAIIEVLKNDKLEALRQKMEQELRKAARIDYANRPLLEHPSPAQLE